MIKQTVMTTVYGVTIFGARKQIGGQLEDIPEFPAEHCREGSKYLTEKTFSSLQEMFTATKKIQVNNHIYIYIYIYIFNLLRTTFLGGVVG